MNNLITLILDIFKRYLASTCVIEENTYLSYADILYRASTLARNLNNHYYSRIRIGLIANNSANWIIVFIAVILSKHRLVLFSPKCLRPGDIDHIIIDSNVSLLYTDVDMFTINFNNFQKELCNVKNITHLTFDNMRMDSPKKFLDTEYIAGTLIESVGKSIIIYTPRHLTKVFIAYEDIVKKLTVLNSYGTFNNTTTYLAYPDFTYNYLLGFLLPFQNDITIVIPYGDEDTYGMKNNFLTHQPEVVILNASQFEFLYKEYIESPLDTFNELLKTLRIWILRRYLLNKKIEQLFSNLSCLIILNTSLNPKIEKILKRLSIPYIITYGRVEDCGITTFSMTKKFVEGSVGEFIMRADEIIDAQQDDKIEQVINDKDQRVIYYYSRREDFEMESSEYPISIEDIERGFRINPLIENCLIIRDKGSLILLVNPDVKYAGYKGYGIEYISRRLGRDIHIYNQRVQPYEKINKVVVTPTKFQKDSYGRILRDRYQPRLKGEHLS